MNKTIVALVVVLAAGCGSGNDEQRPLQYGAPQPPTFEEQGAADTAQTTLAGSLTFQATTDPTFGAPGLPDQLASSLGAYVAAALGALSAGDPAPSPLGIAGPASSRALTVVGIDPACVAITATTATWTGCVIEMTDTDPYTGDTTDMTVTVAGSMASNPATGLTTWDIDVTTAMTMTQGAAVVMTMTSSTALDGGVTVTPSTIVGNSSSSTSVTGSYMSIPLDEAVRTTLQLDLGYQAVPFCITSGHLLLEQTWLQRPVGATEATLPDQGWRFEWTGCDQFQVSHGS